MQISTQRTLPENAADVGFQIQDCCCAHVLFGVRQMHGQIRVHVQAAALLVLCSETRRENRILIQHFDDGLQKDLRLGGGEMIAQRLNLIFRTAAAVFDYRTVLTFRQRRFEQICSSAPMYYA